MNGHGTIFRLWALETPTGGLVTYSVRRTRTMAIEAVWVKKHWPKLRREGWKCVPVLVRRARKD